jgi:hypothetical protein
MDIDLKGSLSVLFDFSFRRFITVRLIRVLYVLALIGIGFATLGLIVTAFGSSAAMGILMLLIGAPIFFFLTLLSARVYLELIVVLFRVSENTSVIAEVVQKAKCGPTTPEAYAPRPMTSETWAPLQEQDVVTA